MRLLNSQGLDLADKTDINQQCTIAIPTGNILTHAAQEQDAIAAYTYRPSAEVTDTALHSQDLTQNNFLGGLWLTSRALGAKNLDGQHQDITCTPRWV